MDNKNTDNKNIIKDLNEFFKEYKWIILCMPIIAVIIVISPVKSKASNDGWLGFLGGYFGSMVSLFILWQSRKETREIQEANEKRELEKQRRSIMPILNFSYEPTVSVYNTCASPKNEEDILIYGRFLHNEGEDIYLCRMNISNVGLGVAQKIEGKIRSIILKSGEEIGNYNMCMYNKPYIETGKIFKVEFNLQFSYEGNIKDIGEINIVLKFKDLLNFNYKQHVKFIIHDGYYIKYVKCELPQLISENNLLR